MAWENRETLFPEPKGTDENGKPNGLPSSRQLAAVCYVSQPTAANFVKNKGGDKFITPSKKDSETVRKIKQNLTKRGQTPSSDAVFCRKPNETAFFISSARGLSPFGLYPAPGTVPVRLKANAKHGLRRSREDKQHALEMAWENRQALFPEPKGTDKNGKPNGLPSSRQLAAVCYVSQPTAEYFIEKSGGVQLHTPSKKDSETVRKAKQNLKVGKDCYGEVIPEGLLPIFKPDISGGIISEREISGLTCVRVRARYWPLPCTVLHGK